MGRYIDEELLIEKMTRLRGCSCSYSDGIIDEIEDIMSDLPTADVIPIPDNATNGDMIKIMFPNMQIDNECNGILYGYKTNDREMPMLGMNLDWWNAPYKKEVEE